MCNHVMTETKNSQSGTSCCGTTYTAQRGSTLHTYIHTYNIHVAPRVVGNITFLIYFSRIKNLKLLVSSFLEEGVCTHGISYPVLSVQSLSSSLGTHPFSYNKSSSPASSPSPASSTSPAKSSANAASPSGKYLRLILIKMSASQLSKAVIAL